MCEIGYRKLNILSIKMVMKPDNKLENTKTNEIIKNCA